VNWTTSTTLRQQLERRWERGHILAARLTGDALFPLRLVLKKPDAAALLDRFDDVRRWTRSLVRDSKEHRDHGYDIEWRRIEHRVHGRNQIPAAAVFPTQDDALHWLGKQSAAKRFDRLCTMTLERFPELLEWLSINPLLVLQHADDWASVLEVLNYFREHPRPDMYLRQLDIPNVDTKFIETRRKLFGELLDAVLPDGAIDRQATGAKGFNHRYGLREPPALIRFRILDPALSVDGLTDLSVPCAQFAQLRLPLDRVFITENQINGLAFPGLPRALVIFGLGYGIDRLAEIDWLKDTPLHYWGDIDTHGFAILDQLRKMFPHTRSLLMDRASLDAHRVQCVQEPVNKRFAGHLKRLDTSELALFEDLKHDRLGERLRLEQERIKFGWLREYLQKIGSNQGNSWQLPE